MQDYDIETLAVRSGIHRSQFNEHSEGLYLTSSFVFENAAQAADRFCNNAPGNIYSRFTNPTVTAFQERLAALEGAQACVATASGMSAILATAMATLKAGDHVVCSSGVFGATVQLFSTVLSKFGIETTYADGTQPSTWRAAMKPNTRLLFLETPSNPLWSITDIAAAAEIAHAAGALLAVDSTAASPVLTRPLSLGADIVMHSATKYLNGHSDVIAGSLTTAKKDEFWQRIVTARSGYGAILGSFEAYLLLRGMRTLYPRVERACRSAQRIADRLVMHPRVLDVLYPGLPNHPGHKVARRQMQGGFGGMLSIRIKDGEAAAIAAAAKVEIWKRATSLGGVESLLEHRASIEGANSPVPPDLLRLSVGIEDPDDLIADLEMALG